MPDPTNRTGSDTQGAFGDQDNQKEKGQGETKYDKDSAIKLSEEKRDAKSAANWDESH